MYIVFPPSRGLLVNYYYRRAPPALTNSGVYMESIDNSNRNGVYFATLDHPITPCCSYHNGGTDRNSPKEVL